MKQRAIKMVPAFTLKQIEKMTQEELLTKAATMTDLLDRMQVHYFAISKVKTSSAIEGCADQAS